MARPNSKHALLIAMEENYSNLIQTIQSLPGEDKNAKLNYNEAFLQKQKEAHWRRDKNVRDILAHIHEWHLLLLNWISNNTSGELLPFLPEPYTWKTYGDMNVEIWKKHQGTPYDKTLNLCNDSQRQALKLIGKFSDQELFTKKHFDWTGSTTLGSYCISATSSHYLWAINKLKKSLILQKNK